MKIDGQWQPENEEELDLFTDLHKAKVKAYNNGIEPDQISAAMSFMASASLVEKPEDVSEFEEEELKEEMRKENAKEKFCPECGVEIMDAKSMGVGGDFYLVPCGHEFQWEDREEIGPWIEDPTDNDEW